MFRVSRNGSWWIGVFVFQNPSCHSSTFRIEIMQSLGARQRPFTRLFPSLYHLKDGKAPICELFGLQWGGQFSPQGTCQIVMNIVDLGMIFRKRLTSMRHFRSSQPTEICDGFWCGYAQTLKVDLNPEVFPRTSGNGARIFFCSCILWWIFKPIGIDLANRVYSGVLNPEKNGPSSRLLDFSR